MCMYKISLCVCVCINTYTGKDPVQFGLGCASVFNIKINHTNIDGILHLLYRVEFLLFPIVFVPVLCLTWFLHEFVSFMKHLNK